MKELKEPLDMLIKSIINRILPQDTKALCRDISSHEEFRSALVKERARSDRNGHGFSVAAFHLGTDSDALLSLVHTLKNQIRTADEIGWYDEDAIGVLLYNTPAKGAWEFIDNVRAKIDEQKIPHACSVFTYPEDWQELDERSGPFNVPETRQPRNAVARSVDNLGRIFHKGLPPWKRVVDFVFSSIGIVILSPVMAAVALAVKLTSKGPALFGQKRAGLGGVPFSCYKFRSMCVDAETKKKDLMAHNERTGPVFKMTNDPRVTPVGRFIRKWSLDELPQLFNVWMGDMSLVGPRPPTLDEVDQYRRWHDYRLDVVPGITCIWQVYARHDKDFENWVRLDIEYTRKRSFFLDMKLLVMTIPAVLSRKGAC